MTRLLQPIIKDDSSYRQISFEDAYSLIATQCDSSAKTLVTVTGDYCNEELYLIQRLSRAGLQTNAITSLEYLHKGTQFFLDKNDILPFAEIAGSSRIFVAWDPQANTPSAQTTLKLLETLKETPQYWFNQEDTLHIQNYAAFFRCLNRYLIEHNLAEGIYVNGLGKDYNTYKTKLLADNYEALLAQNNLKDAQVADFVKLLLLDKSEAIVVWEPLLDARGIIELENLCMLLDIQAKPTSGFLCIKPSLNAQGLYDMGCFSQLSVGGEIWDDATRQQMTELYQKTLITDEINVAELINDKAFTNCLIFNSTGQKIPQDIMAQVNAASFSVLHTADWDEKDTSFDLIIPAALPEEITGSFTDSARIPHQSIPDTDCPLPYNNIEQFNLLNKQLGLSILDNPTSIFLEYITFFKAGCHSQRRHFFR
ncbi:MAG: hypothetical protein K6A41_01070 [Bacteroidales bacterium]|nr:hypothetical protein [Bacteroidales bacterium]